MLERGSNASLESDLGKTTKHFVALPLHVAPNNPVSDEVPIPATETGPPHASLVISQSCGNQPRMGYATASPIDIAYLIRPRSALY